MSFSYETLKVTLHTKNDLSGVLEVRINRPEVRNAFNQKMIEELDRVFSRDALKPGVRVVYFLGEGDAFCAGGDLNWMRRSIELSAEENLKDTRQLSQMFSSLNECSKPVVGAIHGAAIGGGVGLVSICDVVVASEETQFSLSEVRLGVVPACIGPFVVAKIGASHARALFVSAERFNAQKAKEIGLVHEVVSSKDPQTLNTAALRVIKNILQCGPQAVGIAKRLVLDLSWPERRHQHPDYLEYVSKVLANLRVTPEAQEGIKAFLEKRKPQWLNKNS